jgi:hypothetical protein
MEDASILIAELLLCSLRFLSFIRSQDSIQAANGALGHGHCPFATTGIRPVGRKAPKDSDFVQ